MLKAKLKLLVNRFQEAKENGQLQHSSEATIRTWIDNYFPCSDGMFRIPIRFSQSTLSVKKKRKSSIKLALLTLDLITR